MAAFSADVSTGMALDSGMVDDRTEAEMASMSIDSTEKKSVPGVGDTPGSARAYETEETDAFAEMPGGALPPAVKTILGHRQFNTTSTIMAKNTIANPDLPQIFFTWVFF